MTAAIRAEIVFPFTSGVPTDIATNTFYVYDEFASHTDADIATALTPVFTSFYNDAVAADSLSDHMSSIIDRSHCYIQYYTGAVFSSVLSPGVRDTFVLNNPGGTQPLPQEVALCSSFASSVSTIGAIAPGRRRGRVYLGPWNTTIMQSSAVFPPRPNAVILDAIQQSTDALADNINAAGVGQWCIVSRAAGGVPSYVERGWVDNAYDTQRRRGNVATARQTWAV